MFYNDIKYKLALYLPLQAIGFQPLLKLASVEITKQTQVI
jgi:hypothetical protein